MEKFDFQENIPRRKKLTSMIYLERIAPILHALLLISCTSIIYKYRLYWCLIQISTQQKISFFPKIWAIAQLWHTKKTILLPISENWHTENIFRLSPTLTRLDSLFNKYNRLQQHPTCLIAHTFGITPSSRINVYATIPMRKNLPQIT